METLENYHMGRSGRLNVNFPFDKVVKAGLVYKVKGDNLISELIRDNREGVDSLFNAIYSIVGLDKNVFDEDVRNDIRIITLIDSAGNTAYVPSRSIISGIIRDGVVYVEKAMIFNIGAHSPGLDLVSLDSDIKSLIETRLGVMPTSDNIDISTEVMISTNEDIALRASRNKTGSDNLTRLLEKEKARNVVLQTTIDNLECVIKSRVTVP